MKRKKKVSPSPAFNLAFMIVVVVLAARGVIW